MPEVAFHFNVPDRLAYACRLLRKVWRAGYRAQVVLDGPELQSLDQLLWTFAADEFLPHARVGGPPATRQHSPILLTDAVQPDWPAPVLVNLGPEVPAGCESFERVIEIVSLDADDRERARVRWRWYTQAGYPLVRHDLATAGAAA